MLLITARASAGSGTGVLHAFAMPSKCTNDLPTSGTTAAARGKECHTMTALQDIVVLDNSAPSEIRLAIAVALALQDGAPLTGLSSLDLLTPPKPIAQPRGDPEVVSQPASLLMNWGVNPLPHDYSEADTQLAEWTKAACSVKSCWRRTASGT
jgi:hypothetical protein